MPAISSCVGRADPCGPDRCRTHAPDFLAVSPAGSQVCSARGSDGASSSDSRIGNLRSRSMCYSSCPESALFFDDSISCTSQGFIMNIHQGGHLFASILLRADEVMD